MEEFGITPQALADSIQHDLDHPPLYRDAKGNEWDGLGDQPNWLRAAQNAGVDPAFFRIEQPARRSSTTGGDSKRIDPRQIDLFG
jgi:DNA-binding protein H-NS